MWDPSKGLMRDSPACTSTSAATIPQRQEVSDWRHELAIGVRSHFGVQPHMAERPATPLAFSPPQVASCQLFQDCGSLFSFLASTGAAVSGTELSERTHMLLRESGAGHEAAANGVAPNKRIHIIAWRPCGRSTCTRALSCSENGNHARSRASHEAESSVFPVDDVVRPRELFVSRAGIPSDAATSSPTF